MQIGNSTVASLVTPFSTVGRVAVGQENVESKASRLPPVEETGRGGSPQNRRNLNENRSAETLVGSTSRSLADPQSQTDHAVAGAPEDSGAGGQQSADGNNGRQEGRGRPGEQGLTEQELEQVRELAARDREVRAHEQAHQSAAGPYAGAASFSLKRGPDGVSYAVAGEVPIDASAVAGNPEATLRKALLVQKAALAPASPSGQDRQVAAMAAQMALAARAEMATQRREAGESGNSPQVRDASGAEVSTGTAGGYSRGAEYVGIYSAVQNGSTRPGLLVNATA